MHVKKTVCTAVAPTFPRLHALNFGSRNTGNNCVENRPANTRGTLFTELVMNLQNDGFLSITFGNFHESKVTLQW